MALPFAGKVVVVTGGSRGIGKATALLFAEQGADVVVCARDQNTFGLPQVVEETADAVRARGRRALAVRMDIANDDEVRALVDQTLKAFGRIDIVVNNAALAAFGGTYSFLEGDGGLALLDEAYRINVHAPYLLAQRAAMQMAETGGGIVVNVSSPSALHPENPTAPRAGGSPSYGITKAALDRFSSAVTYELRQKNIAVITLYPRGTLTERLAVMYRGRDTSHLETPEMSAKAIVHLCSEPMAHTGKFYWTRDVVDANNL